MCIRDRAEAFLNCTQPLCDPLALHDMEKAASIVRRAVEDGISVVVTTQCLYDSANLQVYQVGNQLLELGVIQGRDMTSEAAMTKLMWAIGQGYSPDKIKALFEENLAGEIEN